MNTKKDITSHNEKYQRHGMWQRYRDDGTVWYKCNYVNGVEVGYEEWGSGTKIFYLR